MHHSVMTSSGFFGFTIVALALQTHQTEILLLLLLTIFLGTTLLFVLLQTETRCQITGCAAVLLMTSSLALLCVVLEENYT